MEESIDRLMRACGLRSFAYRRYPPIHIVSPSPVPAVPKAVGTDDAGGMPDEAIVAQCPMPPENPPSLPDLRPAGEAAAAGRTALPTAVRLRRARRPATARAEAVQGHGDRAEPSPASPRAAPVAAQLPPLETAAPPASAQPSATSPTRPRADSRATFPRTGERPWPVVQAPATAASPAGPARRFALLDEVSTEAAGPQAEPRPVRSAPGPAQDPPGPGRPRPRLRLHTRNGGAA